MGSVWGRRVTLISFSLPPSRLGSPPGSSGLVVWPSPAPPGLSRSPCGCGLGSALDVLVLVNGPAWRQPPGLPGPALSLLEDAVLAGRCCRPSPHAHLHTEAPGAPCLPRGCPCPLPRGFIDPSGTDSCKPGLGRVEPWGARGRRRRRRRGPGSGGRKRRAQGRVREVRELAHGTSPSLGTTTVQAEVSSAADPGRCPRGQQNKGAPSAAGGSGGSGCRGRDGSLGGKGYFWGGRRLPVGNGRHVILPRWPAARAGLLSF